MSSVITPDSLNWLYRGTSEIFPCQPDSNNPEENLEEPVDSNKEETTFQLSLVTLFV